MKRLLFFLCLSVSVLLTGCGTFRSRHVSPDASTDVAHVKLAEAAASVSHSLLELAEIEAAVHPGSKLPPPPDPERVGMQRLASVDWSGPVESVMRELAKASHYQLHVIGRRPATPVLVALHAKNTPLAYIYRDIKYQAHKKAKIVRYPRKRIIELRYIRRG